MLTNQNESKYKTIINNNISNSTVQQQTNNLLVANLIIPSQLKAGTIAPVLNHSSFLSKNQSNSTNQRDFSVKIFEPNLVFISIFAAFVLFSLVFLIALVVGIVYLVKMITSKKTNQETVRETKLKQETRLKQEFQAVTTEIPGLSTEIPGPADPIYEEISSNKTILNSINQKINRLSVKFKEMDAIEVNKCAEQSCQFILTNLNYIDHIKRHFNKNLFNERCPVCDCGLNDLEEDFKDHAINSHSDIIDLFLEF